MVQFQNLVEDMAAAERGTLLTKLGATIQGLRRPRTGTRALMPRAAELDKVVPKVPEGGARSGQGSAAPWRICGQGGSPGYTADLTDEAIYLTTAFQLAGYPHVIGTLWDIDDPLAVNIAENFYESLITGT